MYAQLILGAIPISVLPGAETLYHRQKPFAPSTLIGQCFALTGARYSTGQTYVSKCIYVVFHSKRQIIRIRPSAS